MIAGRRWLLGLSAVAGVVLAHTAVYALVHVDSGGRAAHLALTGHGYWPVALALAGLAALVTVVGVVAGAAASSGPGGLPATGFGSRLVRLSACQAALFTVMEVLERAFTAGASPTLALRPEFVLGLLLQVVVAAAILVVLSVLHRATERLTRLRRPIGASRPRAGYGPAVLSWGPRTTLGGAARPRGPPLPASA